jgi:hypothetical protein
MKKLIMICVAFFTISGTNLKHDAVVATFNIIEKGHVLLLEIEFDEENYIKFGGAESLKVTKADFSKYLKEKTSWQIDNEEIIPQILHIKSVKQHTKVVCFLSKAKKNIKTVKVKNEFLIDVENHSNIIQLDINNSFKDFRLHKDRIQLQVDY